MSSVQEDSHILTTETPNLSGTRIGIATVVAPPWMSRVSVSLDPEPKIVWTETAVSQDLDGKLVRLTIITERGRFVSVKGNAQLTHFNSAYPGCFTLTIGAVILEYFDEKPSRIVVGGRIYEHEDANVSLWVGSKG